MATWPLEVFKKFDPESGYPVADQWADDRGGPRARRAPRRGALPLFCDGIEFSGVKEPRQSRERMGDPGVEPASAGVGFRGMSDGETELDPRLTGLFRRGEGGPITWPWAVPVLPLRPRRCAAGWQRRGERTSPPCGALRAIFRALRGRSTTFGMHNTTGVGRACGYGVDGLPRDMAQHPRVCSERLPCVEALAEMPKQGNPQRRRSRVWRCHQTAPARACACIALNLGLGLSARLHADP